MLRLDENYTVSCDKYGWKLGFSETRAIPQPDGTTKVTKSESSWYYGSLESTLKKYVDCQAKLATDFITLRNILSATLASIERLCLGIKKTDVGMEIPESEFLPPIYEGSTFEEIIDGPEIDDDDLL